MSAHYFTRDDWGAREARGGPGPLDPAQVVGIALHWPGLTSPIRGVSSVKAALRGWQDFHMDSRGWSDIAYQEAVDQDGNVYRLRGFRTQSGANGDEDVNERFGALLLIVAPGETPTSAMIAAVRSRVARFADLYPKGSRIVGHGDIRPGGTECPGALVTSLIRRGAFRPSHPNRVMLAHGHLSKAIELLGGVPNDRKAVQDALALARRAQATLPER